MTTRLYKAHKTSVGYWEITAYQGGETGAYLLIRHAKSDDATPVEQTVQVKPKNVGRANETTPMQQANLEMNSRINKQLDKGYVFNRPELGSVVKNTLGLEKPMLATPIQKVKPETIDWENAWLQPKLDGNRALFKNGVLYSRQGKEINLPHITEALSSIGTDVHFDGELSVSYTHLTLPTNREV